MNNGETIVNLLATLLTSGRMNAEKRKYLVQHFNWYSSNNEYDSAVRRIQELSILTPEFHSTGIVETKSTLRSLPKANTKTCTSHKAIVHLMLYGGMDSYNLLVPHSGCRNGGKYFLLQMTLSLF